MQLTFSHRPMVPAGEGPASLWKVKCREAGWEGRAHAHYQTRKLECHVLHSWRGWAARAFGSNASIGACHDSGHRV